MARKSSINPNSVGVSNVPPRTASDGVVMTEYLVVPDGFRAAVTPNKHQWTVKVRRLDLTRDSWMVTSQCGQYAWTVYGEMVRIAGLSRHQLRQWCEMTLKDAHNKALVAVASIRVNGRTLAEEDSVVVQMADVDRRRGEASDVQRRRREGREIRAQLACAS